MKNNTNYPFSYNITEMFLGMHNEHTSIQILHYYAHHPHEE